MNDPTFDEMYEYLKHLLPAEVDEFDEFDVAEAIYNYAVGYHSGQWSNLYAAITLCRFQPGAYYTGIDGEAALELYQALCDHYGEPFHDKK